MRWSRRTEWVYRVMAGRVLMARRDGEQRTLGGLATAVWVVLDEPATTTEVVDRLGELSAGETIEEQSVVDALEMLVGAEAIDRIEAIS